MAGDSLLRVGLHLDEINSLRVLDPEIAGPTVQLKDELKEFLTSTISIVVMYIGLLTVNSPIYITTIEKPKIHTVSY